MSEQQATREPAVEPKPSGYQPTKAELEEVVKIDATPSEIARAVLAGGAARREP